MVLLTITYTDNLEYCNESTLRLDEQVSLEVLEGPRYLPKWLNFLSVTCNLTLPLEVAPDDCFVSSAPLSKGHCKAQVCGNGGHSLILCPSPPEMALLLCVAHCLPLVGEQLHLHLLQ